MSDMNNFPQHGDLCIGKGTTYICSGYFVGVVKLLGGVQYAVLQPNKNTDQLSLVYLNTIEPYTGSVIYRDRSKETPLKVLPPLISSKY